MRLLLFLCGLTAVTASAHAQPASNPLNNPWTDPVDVRALQAAAPTDAYAAIRLAEGYELGRWGLKVRPDSALYWERKAAEAGNAIGQFLMGNRYLRAVGVKRDVPRALKLLSQAAEQQQVSALNLLTSLYSDSSSRIFQDAGTYVKPDAVRALHYAAQSAKLGDTKGLYYTGRAYWLGIGTARNDSIAHRWLLQAAEDRNYAPAQALLGDMYRAGGKHISQDIAVAQQWYLRAYNNPSAPIEEQTLGKVGLYAVEQLYRRVHNANLRALYLLAPGTGRLYERQ